MFKICSKCLYEAQEICDNCKENGIVSVRKYYADDDIRSVEFTTSNGSIDCKEIYIDEAFEYNE